MSEHVTVTREGPVSHVRLARPEKLNAFSDALVEGLHEAVTAARGDGTRLMVFTGEGKGFSGGFDLDGLEAMSDGDLLLRFVRVESMLQAVQHAPFTTLALAHGACFGAAADLFAACQWRAAAPGTRFRMPGPKFGVILGTRRLATLIGADAARRLLLRDAPFELEEALASGFAGEACPREDWPALISRVLAAATSLDPAVTAIIAERLGTDTRDADMAALVRSVSEGSIKARLLAYVQAMRAKR